MDGPFKNGQNLPEWYPRGIPDPTTSPDLYGPAQLETLERFNTLRFGSTILDLAGGYGRYAVPLAEAGHQVTIVDIDESHLLEAGRRSEQLQTDVGSIRTIQADILTTDLSELGEFDAGLCAGFIYLAPEEIIRRIFRRFTMRIRSDGLVVTEFATERERRDQNGQPLMGPDEQNYTRDAGEGLMRDVYAENGFDQPTISIATVEQDTPYYLRNTLLIASAIRSKPAPS